MVEPRVFATRHHLSLWCRSPVCVCLCKSSLLLSLSCRWLCAQTCGTGQDKGQEIPVWAKPRKLRQNAMGKASLQALHKAGPLFPPITSSLPPPTTYTPRTRNVSKDTGVCWFLASNTSQGDSGRQESHRKEHPAASQEGHNY